MKNIAYRYDSVENEYGWSWEFHITFPDGRYITFREGDYNGVPLNAAARPAEMVEAKEIADILHRYADYTGETWVLEYLEEGEKKSMKKLFLVDENDHGEMMGVALYVASSEQEAIERYVNSEKEVRYISENSVSAIEITSIDGYTVIVENDKIILRKEDRDGTN